MSNKWNLKILLHNWFHYKEEDDAMRLCWIKKHIGEQDIGKCTTDTDYNLYKDGVWRVK